MPVHRRTFVLSLLSLLATAIGFTRATCTGADPCNACKNCRYCQRCAKDKNTCGTCKRALERTNEALLPNGTGERE